MIMGVVITLPIVIVWGRLAMGSIVAIYLEKEL